jgi:hypothetical protein
MDEDGYLIGWIHRRINESVPITAENSARGHRELVGDDYPNNVDDALHELVEQARRATNSTPDTPMSGAEIDG